MELIEIQSLWNELSSKIEKQKVLTDKIILEMTKERYRNKIAKISSYETAGTVACFLAAMAILINILKLDTWYLLAMGVFCASYLVIMPILVLVSIYRLKSIPIATDNLKRIIDRFMEGRRHFLSLQRTAIYLNFILMFAILPVVVKIVDGDDVFTAGHNLWYWYVPVQGLFLVFFSRWGYGHYNRISRSAENILKELENDYI